MDVFYSLPSLSLTHSSSLLFVCFVLVLQSKWVYFCTPFSLSKVCSSLFVTSFLALPGDNFYCCGV
eukprot:m.221894 g.221894  ORF g.221894 m.221894 type:complete len:66 (-) comp15908_c0_seq1:89-286(-)